MCLEQEGLLREPSTLSNKIKLEVYDFVLNGDEVINYKIEKIPATAVGYSLIGAIPEEALNLEIRKVIG
jgi:hypothetical protein